jgi:ribonuclease R
VKRPHGLPSREELIAFVNESTTPVTKREIARAFNVKADDRVALKRLLRELQESGALERDRGKAMKPRGSLPAITLVRIVAIDADGETLAKPDDPDLPQHLRIYVKPQRGHPALGEGDRVLVELKRLGPSTYEAKPLKMIDGEIGRIVGTFSRTGDSGRIAPAEKGARSDFFVDAKDTKDAPDGALVVGEIVPDNKLGMKRARIVEVLGQAHDPRAISMLAVHEHGIPHVFPQAAIDEATAAQNPGLEGRTDLRDVPLVTIDGEDARDFDDAVFATPDEASDNQGGWRLVVAIADVSYFVRPGSPLDKTAFERGNSVYFPDRVVPMLPERLSNDLCSLRPHEPRACLAFEMRITKDGEMIAHRLMRGLMRSAARLTYTQVQAAFDGATDDVTSPLLDPVIRPLYGAYAALSRARAKRGTLEIELPERKVTIDRDGGVAKIATRERLDSHKLIEEFMILANVAAAETLEKFSAPCMYRVHDKPDPVKVEALRSFIAGLGLSFPGAGTITKPALFTKLLRQAEETPEAHVVNTIVLRTQAQAVYSPDNLGHFGLALSRYAHFTSPIRRYADLLVHRSLVRALKLGPGPLSEAEAAKFDEIGDHISKTERRAAEAERDAVDRFTALYLQDRVGAQFSGRIGGVTRFGLFVTLDETGADGLVPIRTLPNDYYRHDEKRHALIGERSGRTYRLGERVKIILREADAVTGSTLFELVDENAGAREGGNEHGPRRLMQHRGNRPPVQRSAPRSKAPRKGKRG